MNAIARVLCAALLASLTSALTFAPLSLAGHHEE